MSTSKERSFEIPVKPSRLVQWAVEKGLMEARPHVALPRPGQTAEVKGSAARLTIRRGTDGDVLLNLNTRGDLEGHLVALAITPSKNGERDYSKTALRFAPLAPDMKEVEDPREQRAYTQLRTSRLQTCRADVYLPLSRWPAAYTRDHALTAYLMRVSLSETQRAGFPICIWEQWFLRNGGMPDHLSEETESLARVTSCIQSMQAESPLLVALTEEPAINLAADIRPSEGRLSLSL